MKPTRLQWEDVIQFEEVKGYGQHIWRDGNHLYYVDEEGGIAPHISNKRERPCFVFLEVFLFIVLIFFLIKMRICCII